MKVLRSLIITFLIVAATPMQSLRADDAPRIDLEVTFSTDGGQTYSKDVPRLAKPGVVNVRVTWENPRPDDERDVYTTSLSCEQTDFASANVGKQSWSGAPAWYQRPTKYYVGTGDPHVFDYDLDLGARPEGTTGFRNVWDKDRNEQVDGPLPPCLSLADGSYKFMVKVSYWLKKVEPNRRVEGRSEFTLTIGTAESAAKR